MDTLKPMSSRREVDVERPNTDGERSTSEEHGDELQMAASRTEEAASVQDRSSPELSSSRRNAGPGTSSGALDDEWSNVAAEFVDDPRRAVTRAHELVERAVQSTIENLKAQRSAIEQQWKQAGDSDTETMRICLQQYRALAQRLSVSTASGRGREASFPSHQDVPNPTHH